MINMKQRSSFTAGFYIIFCLYFLFMAEILYSDEENIIFDFFTSASLGCENCLDFLSSKEDINATNSSGWTGLMYASYYGHSKIVKCLLEKGAGFEIQNNLGRTALILAAMCGKEDVCRILLLAGAKLETKDINEWNALFHATHFNHHSIVKLFLQFGADPNTIETKSESEFTPFLLSAYNGHELVFQYYLNFKANLMSRLKSGESVEELAVKQNHMKILQLYRSALCQEMETKGENQFTNINTGFFSDTDVNRDFYCNDLSSFLSYLGLEKYFKILEEQDVDLQVFLTLSDHDLKEIGITRIGPRRKMTSAIARWHSSKSFEREKGLLNISTRDLQIQLEKSLEKEFKSFSLMNECVTNEKLFVDNCTKLCADAYKYFLEIKKKCNLKSKDNIVNKLEDCLKELNFKLNDRVMGLELKMQNK